MSRGRMLVVGKAGMVRSHVRHPLLLMLTVHHAATAAAAAVMVASIPTATAAGARCGTQASCVEATICEREDLHIRLQ